MVEVTVKIRALGPFVTSDSQLVMGSDNKRCENPIQPFPKKKAPRERFGPVCEQTQYRG